MDTQLIGTRDPQLQRGLLDHHTDPAKLTLAGITESQQPKMQTARRGHGHGGRHWVAFLD
jgi:hypothetical protein